MSKSVNKPDRSNNKICITTTQRKIPVNTSKIYKLVKFIAKQEKVNIEFVDISIVGAKAMATFNNRHLGHEGSTDVISFDLSSRNDELYAQIIVCSDVAIKQSKTRSNTPETEMLLYITHGLLHAIGYDDHDEEDYLLMHKRENTLLEKFGLGRKVFG